MLEPMQVAQRSSVRSAHQRDYETRILGPRLPLVVTMVGSIMLLALALKV